MKKKLTEGEWIIDDIDILSESGMAICQVYDASDSHILDMDMGVVNANTKLIAAAPNMLDALLETDKDLCVLESTMAQIESTDPLAEGMTELVKKWRERNKLANNKATE